MGEIAALSRSRKSLWPLLAVRCEDGHAEQARERGRPVTSGATSDYFHSQ